MNEDQNDLPELRELNEMLELAGAITDAIDRLVLLRDRMKIQYYSSMALVIFFTFISFAFLFYKTANGKGFFVDSELEVSLAIISIIFFSVIFLIVTFIKNTQLQNVNRDLHSEIYVHQKVISLIDEQTRRVRTSSPLSALKVATLEIRLARLDRSNLAKKLNML